MESREAAANIHVISDKVLIFPSQVHLKPGESTEFRGSFGTETYTFTCTCGEGIVDEISGILTYTAPSKTGTHFITVFDSAGNSAMAEAVVSGGFKRKKIDKTKIFEITDPGVYPNSETQPAAVGSVQEGGKTFFLAFDFPNYEDDEGSPVATNFYVLAVIPDLALLFLFDDKGGIIDMDKQIAPCMSRVTDAVYTEVLELDFCNPGAPLKVDMYILAIESEYDPNGNLDFEPADAPFELWYYDFSFSQCQ